MSKVLRIPSLIGEIELSPIALGDLDASVRYLYGSSDEFLTQIGFDISKRPAKEDYIAFMKNKLSSPLDEVTGVSARIGKSAFAAVYMRVNENEVVAHAHFHIWDEELRGRGLGKDILINGLKLLMDFQKRESAFIEPHQKNNPMNKLMKKCNFEFVKEDIYISPRTLDFPSYKYLIKRSNL